MILTFTSAGNSSEYNKHRASSTDYSTEQHAVEWLPMSRHRWSRVACASRVEDTGTDDIL